MHTSAIVSGILSLFAISATAFPTDLTPRQSTDDVIGLYFNGTGTTIDIGYLETLRVSFANSSAYIGEIKYEVYSEPLVVGSFSGTDNGVSFLSIHSSPTGFQYMYTIPDQSLPVAFSPAHGSAPSGVTQDGFSFGPDGALLQDGLNNFYACQDANLAALNSYQIYWVAAGTPAGLTCQGPIVIQAGDGCSRY